MPSETLISREDLAELVHRYADMMLRIAFTYVKNHADAEDICQEVFIKIAKQHKTFQHAEHEKAWIIRITINASKDALRSPWKKLFSPINEASLPILHQGNNEVVACVLELPKKYRIVIYLYYFEGYSTTEIAELVRRNENTVRTHLRRTRELLRKSMIGGFVNE
ncbi:sigma-70 family RNA polymerase sigma factor [Paenibacillus sp. LHD-38]|uniref:sigma-70 family RNA polymerase sigma factor n=1 Tax=Paenibacillus sp. LHD-38 TaxID=3072143 RepID=UPI00280FE75F|nr:sigma-70 family RNA polymerase sigma factor [Paenibacillus sp. LHD-38]MDQ8738967.1 sigma-70 family RNA polymerase sigma factor [Paenibacillus sp. LHD-38]